MPTIRKLKQLQSRKKAVEREAERQERLNDLCEVFQEGDLFMTNVALIIQDNGLVFSDLRARTRHDISPGLPAGSLAIYLGTKTVSENNRRRRSGWQRTYTAICMRFGGDVVMVPAERIQGAGVEPVVGKWFKKMK